MANTSIFSLKLQNSSKIFEFFSWYEMAYQETTTNEETGKTRKRKGNAKKHFIESIEYLLTTGKITKEFQESIEKFNSEETLSPELQTKISKMNPVEFKSFIQALEQAKAKV